MFDPADKRFLAAIQDIMRQVEMPENACLEAFDRATGTENPLDIKAAMKKLDELDQALKEDILRKAHARLTTDLSAIWDAMPTAPGSRKPN